MFDTKNFYVALFVILLLGCTAPPAPTVTFATVTPTTESTSTSTATPPPASTLVSTVTPQPTSVPPPTAQLEPPEMVYAMEPLEILEVEPANGTTEIDISNKQTRITARFNFPVVPLSEVNLPNARQQPLTIEPNIDFQGRWINSFTYAISPTHDLEIGTTYTVTAQTVTDETGRVSKPRTWNFTTMMPRVIATEPQGKGRMRVRGVSQPITVTFNAAMDRASVETRFRVMKKDNRWTALGEFSWRDNALGFTPTYPLEYDTTYLVQMLPGAQDIKHRSTVGGLGVEFVTVKKFALVSSSPKDGEKDSTAIRDEHAGLILKFTQPMNANDLRVSIAPTITNQVVEGMGQNIAERTFHYRVSGGWQASTAYTVTIHSDTRSTFGELLGRDTILHFTTAPLEPYIWVHLPAIGLYDANGPQTVYTSWTNVTRIEYELYRVPREKLFKLLSDDSWNLQERVSNYEPLPSNLARFWAQSFPNRINAGGIVSTTLNDAVGKRADAGAYLLRATSPNLDCVDSSLVLVSPYNLALKFTDSEALVWLTDLSNGKPVANQPITIYAHWGKELASGKTDGDGIFRAQNLFENDAYAYEAAVPHLFAVSEVNGAIVAMTASDWDEGIAKWDYNISTGGYQGYDRYHVNMYTDRAVYRTGQTVYFKGILRRNLDPRPDVPHAWQTTTRKDEQVAARVGVESVHLTVYNSQYETILEQDAPLNDFGTFNGEIVLDENAPTGEYRIETDYGTLLFNVDQYRRPEFQVAVHADQAEYRNGDTIHVNINSTYFFGGPVADAQVNWRVFAEQYDARPNVEGWWDFFDNTQENYSYARNSDAAQISEGEARTDAQGNFEFDITADLKEFAQSQTFTLEAEIVDMNHQSVSNRVTVPVHKGAFYIGLKPQSYIGGIDKEETIDVLTVNAIVNQDQALERAQQRVAISMYQGEWNYAREWVDGYWQWNSTYSETLLSKMDVVTDEQGKAFVKFTPTRGGQYRIAAEGTDERGNVIKSATWLYVWGDGYVGWKIDNTNRLELVTDKKEYVPGDVAEILVPAPFADAEALFTIERGGIWHVERVPIQGNTAQYRVPIVEEYVPNIFVSVMLVHGRGAGNEIPQFKMGYATLQVKPVAQALNVSVRASCTQALVLASNVSRAPEPMEKNVAQDSAPTRTCQPNDTATFDIDARDAHDKPVRAEFSVALVDKAIQTLMSDNSSPLLSTFYQARGLAVNTATTLIQSIEQDNVTVRAQTKGGGGGGGGEIFQVRRDFRDTAYWNPVVRTDENGHAQVQTKLPDNLTTWNVTVKGVTLDTRVGEARADMVSTRPLLIRPVTPRFFVVGDKTIIEAVVHNNTDKREFTTVLLDANGLTLNSPAARTFAIPAHDKISMQWETTTNVTDHAKLLFSATANHMNDAVELTLPVQYPITVETLASVEPVDARLVKLVELNDASLLPNQFDQLQIELTPSLAAASRESLKYLESYPWECSEQTTSKFLPNIATYLALERLHLERQDLYYALQTNVSREIQRLYFLQNADGGWGWWRNHSSRPVLTAYALYALTQAEQVGFAVDKEVVKRAQTFLLDSLNEPRDDSHYNMLNERAFTIFVLAERGLDMKGRALNLFELRANLDNYAKAFLLMALAQQRLTQAKTLKQELVNAAHVTDEYVYWQEKQNDAWLMNTNVRTQAIVVMALARVDSSNSLLPKAVKWLMNARKLGERFVHWETTQETTWSVMALTEWMAASGELESNYAYQVTVNGKLIGDGQVNAENLDEARTLRVSIQETLTNLANEIIITRDSTKGTLYYSAYLRRYLNAQNIPPVTRGIVVQRTYYAVDPRTLNATTRAIDSAKIGDYVQVKLTIVLTNHISYLAVEDMLPAGFEAVDTSLLTSSRAASGPERVSERGAYHPYWWYWGHDELRDDRVGLFSQWMARGTYEYTYLIRASIAGTFHALPTRAYAMYDPTVMGQGGGSVFTIQK